MSRQPKMTDAEIGKIAMAFMTEGLMAALNAAPAFPASAVEAKLRQLELLKPSGDDIAVISEAIENVRGTTYPWLVAEALIDALTPLVEEHVRYLAAQANQV